LKQDASAGNSSVFPRKEKTFSGTTVGNSYHDLLKTRKANGDPYLNKCSEHFHLGTGIAKRLRTKNFEMVNNGLVQLPISVSEKTQNIGPMFFIFFFFSKIGVVDFGGHQCSCY